MGRASLSSIEKLARGADGHFLARSYVTYFFTVVVACLILACIYHSLLSVAGYGFPWDTFLFMPEDRYNDWHNSVAAAATLDPYFAPRRALSVYFPFAYVVFLAGSGHFWAASAALYLAVSFGLLGGAVGYTWRRGRQAEGGPGEADAKELALLFLAVLLSYPVLFALDRGNLEVWIASMCVFYVAALGTRHEWLGFAALSIAIAVKGYPVAFLVLALARRSYLSTVLCGLAAVALNLFALAMMKGGIVHNVQGWMLNLGAFQQLYVLGPNSLFATSDPYNGIRSLVWIVPDAWRYLVPAGGAVPSIEAWSAAILRPYTALSFSFAVCGALFALAVPARNWQRVMAICLVVLLFPNVANDYKLCMLLPGVLALVLEEDRSPRGWIALALACLLMVPKSYYFFAGGHIGVTNLINPVLLLVLAVVVIADGEAWRRFSLRRCPVVITEPGAAGSKGGDV